MPTFEVGRIYDRKLEIHGPSAGPGSGNTSAGITKIGGVQCVFWNPYLGLYVNRWIERPAEFIYSGEGNLGDMVETRSANASLIQCENDGTLVCLFYKVARTGSRWQHLGKYQVVQHGDGASQDDAGNWRRDIRFHFRAAEQVQTRLVQGLPSVPPSRIPKSPTEEELWEILARTPTERGTARRRRTRVNNHKRESDPVTTMYVRARVLLFGGDCELCRVRPEWTTSSGYPHYQAHHLNPDIDAVDWIAGICGTCHDRLHHSTDRELMAEELRQFIAERHLSLGHAPSIVDLEHPIVLVDERECLTATL